MTRGSRNGLIAFIVLLVAAIGITIAVKSGRGHGSGNAGLQSTTIQLSWKAEPLFGGIYVAQAKGYFKEAGYEVTLVHGSGDDPAVQLIGAGTGPLIGTAGGASTLIGRSKGIPIKSVLMIYPRTPTVMVSLPRSPISKPQDMLGKRIGLIPGGGTTNEYRALCEANGIDRAKVTEVTVDWSATPLLNGDVDALIFFEDTVPVQLAVQGKNPVLMRFRDFGVDLYALNIIANDSIIQKDPEGVKKLTQAIARGYEVVRSHPDEASDVFLKAYPERDPAFVRASMKVVATMLGGKIGEQSREGWESSIETLSKLGLLSRRPTVDEVMAKP